MTGSEIPGRFGKIWGRIAPHGFPAQSDTWCEGNGSRLLLFAHGMNNLGLQLGIKGESLVGND
jgi:hypothetical protein